MYINAALCLIIKSKSVTLFKHTLRTIDSSTFLNQAFLVSLSNSYVLMLRVYLYVITNTGVTLAVLYPAIAIESASFYVIIVNCILLLLYFS